MHSCRLFKLIDKKRKENKKIIGTGENFPFFLLCIKMDERKGGQFLPLKEKLHK
jgi:hypothetical protein